MKGRGGVGNVKKASRGAGLPGIFSMQLGEVNRGRKGQEKGLSFEAKGEHEFS